MLFKLISASVLTFSFGVQAAEITLTAKDGMQLKADYYQSKKTSNRAVLMLHQCNYNRTMYNHIGEQLAKRNIHALSLDFRALGKV